jgi:arsenite/tail-anchored protein-transporting ATPase
MRDLRFFIGKGGVGKTTVASAYAVWAAAQRPRGSVLLMSTDPAHSVSDVFGLGYRGEKRRIKLDGPGRLDLWQIDPRREFKKFLSGHRQAILTLIENGTFFRKWEIEPLLDTTLPGMAEIAGLLALSDLRDSGEYDAIVVDTAPMGHTLRLFEFPQHFANFLHFLEVAATQEKSFAARFQETGLSPERFLASWRSAAEAVVSAMTGPTRLVLVTTPEVFSLQESVRAADALAHYKPPLSFHTIVMNRAVTSGGTCRWCEQRACRTKEGRKFLAEHFAGLPVMTGEDAGAPVIGSSALLAFGRHVFEGAPLRLDIKPPTVANIEFRAAAWPWLQTSLSLTIGKGGVGKTTVSAAMAYHTRKVAPATAVTICSTDPAPSLDDIFVQSVDDRPVSVLGDRQLRAAEFDAAAHLRAWPKRAQHEMDEALARQSARSHINLDFEKRLFRALLDIVPPGLDELLATFRVLEMVEDEPGLVLIDMAPTGHALELLRMPDRILRWSRLLLNTLAPHITLQPIRDLSDQVTAIGKQAREVAKLLKDRTRARVYPVMLAEPLPDRETGRLLRVLDELAVETAPLFVNRVMVAPVGSCKRCALARGWQFSTLANIRRKHGPVFVIQNYPHEIAGAAALDALTRELWQPQR